MVQLLIDLGNTRVKWALRLGGRLGRMQAAPLGDGEADALQRVARAGARAHQIWVVSVAGALQERRLRQCLRLAGAPSARFVTSQPRTAGVRNGYRDSWRLGADRWVAAVGAWHEAGRQRAVAVVDIGTATTLDVVDRTGRHRGGLIIPGPALMVESLLKGTRGIARRAAGSRRPAHAPLARDTASALRNGARQATAAFIAHSAESLRNDWGADSSLYLTGGGATELVGVLPSNCQLVPDLVLRGLAVIADDSPSGPRPARPGR